MSALGFKARVDPLTCVPLSLVHNGILRFTSGATPADFLAAIGQPLLNWSFEEKTFVKQSLGTVLEILTKLLYLSDA